MQKIKKLLIAALACITIGASATTMAACDVNAMLGMTSDLSGLPITSENGGMTSTAPSEGLQYTYNETSDSYFLSGLGTCTSPKIVVASEYKGKAVTTISYDFTNSGITDITIPSSVKDTSKSEFQYCTTLKNVYYTGTATEWAQIKFVDMEQMDNEEDDSEPKIGQPLAATVGRFNAFMRENEEDLNFRELYNWFDSNATKLYIGGKLLEEATLTSPTPMEVSPYAFVCCVSLKKLAIGQGITGLGLGSMGYCLNLQELTIGADLQTVDRMFLDFCYKLQEISYGGTQEAFEQLISTLGYEDYRWYFDENTWVSRIVCGDGNIITIDRTYDPWSDEGDLGGSGGGTATPDSSSPGGSWEDSSSSYEEYVPVEEGLTFELSTNGIYYIVTGYVEDYKGESHYAYGDRCIAIPETYEGKPVKRIAADAFNGCGMEAVVVPDSINYIEDEAFRSCAELKYVEIGKDVIEIGENVFTECENLRVFDVAGNNQYYFSVNQDYCSGLYQRNDDYETCTLIQYALGSEYEKDNWSRTNLEIFEEVSGDDGYLYTVTEIGAWACAGFDDLDYISLDGVTTIEANAFNGCSNITEVYLSDWLTTIGDNAFYYCINLEGIYIPDSVTEIGAGAFCGCVDLTNVRIGYDVTSIGAGAFTYCDGLQSVTYDGTAEEWNAIELADDWAADSAIKKVVCSDETITLE